ncbi:MAG: hypothetical protein GY719_10940 [bacterium]|nr:hypothetical protein [bacterium]
MNHHWRAAGRAVRNALRPTASVRFLGRTYRVTNAARNIREDRDYPLLARLAGASAVSSTSARISGWPLW